MSDSRGYFEDRIKDEENKYFSEKEYSKEVLNILDLFRLLKVSDKVAVKRLIETEKLL